MIYFGNSTENVSFGTHLMQPAVQIVDAASGTNDMLRDHITCSFN